MQTRSRPKVGIGYHGPLPKAIWLIVRKAWEEGVAVSSNFAREHAPEIALAASQGWISNIALDGKHYLRTWNVTAEGVAAWNHERKSP